jgi:hypothetical protein
MTALIRMYGVPLLTYTVLGNVSYPADINGLITGVAEGDVRSLVDRGCITEAQWLNLQTAHPAPTTPSSGSSGVVQMSDGAGKFLASQITDTGTRVKIANGTIQTPPATPLTLISDTGVALGAYPTQGQDTINAGAVYANSVQLKPVAGFTGTITTASLSGKTITIANGLITGFA